MATAPEDRGMLAVRRVRSVRETDSRVGLQQAVVERRAAGTRVSDLRTRLTAAGRDQRDGAIAGASTAAFLAGRAALLSMSSALRDAEEAWETSRTLTEAARAQWQVDRTRLEAIDLLLQRRAELRRAERLRVEARELDDLAGQRWLRDRSGDRSGDAGGEE